MQDRLLDAAAEIIVETGWSDVTMGKIADRVGVSRQTVYNGLGGKADLAEALIMRELARFLVVVDAELARTDEPVEAIRRTARAVFEMAQSNPLLRSVLSASHGKDTGDLLPLLTTESEPLMAAAEEVLAGHLDRLAPHLDRDGRRIAVDAVVRLVLSQVMRPNGSPGEAADALAWISARVLRPD